MTTEQEHYTKLALSFAKELTQAIEQMLETGDTVTESVVDITHALSHLNLFNPQELVFEESVKQTTMGDDIICWTGNNTELILKYTKGQLVGKNIVFTDKKYGKQVMSVGDSIAENEDGDILMVTEDSYYEGL